MPVHQSNPKAFEELNFRLAELDGFVARVGWFETAKYEDGTPVGYVAAIQELGSPARSIPPRPFMRPAQIKNEQKWRETANASVTDVLAGKMKPRDAWENLALQVEGDVLQAIVDVDSPALSPLTLALRKWKKMNKDEKVTGKIVGMVAKMLKAGEIDTSGVSIKPLNDTGHMIATLTSNVESVQ